MKRMTATVTQRVTLLVTLLGALAATGVTGCGSKRATTTPTDPAGGAAYGGDTYGTSDGASEPTGEPRPDPDGGDPCGY